MALPHQGSGLPPQPILKDFKNIECRDAVLAWDASKPVRDEHGVPQPLGWRDHENAPGHRRAGAGRNRARAAGTLHQPAPAEWPQADYIVGNPPFIGAAPMRAALGDGYVEALRKTWQDVPESADFVMFWWHHAAQLVASGQGQRFGLITTNSLKQTFNRRVVQARSTTA
jgi:hypothetical protein